MKKLKNIIVASLIISLTCCFNTLAEDLPTVAWTSSEAYHPNPVLLVHSFLYSGDIAWTGMVKTLKEDFNGYFDFGFRSLEPSESYLHSYEYGKRDGLPEAYNTLKTVRGFATDTTKAEHNSGLDATDPDRLDSDDDETLEVIINRLSAGYGNMNINIVAHGSGGLIARKYLSKFRNVPKVDRFVAVATPHKGVFPIKSEKECTSDLASAVGIVSFKSDDFSGVVTNFNLAFEAMAASGVYFRGLAAQAKGAFAVVGILLTAYNYNNAMWHYYDTEFTKLEVGEPLFRRMLSSRAYKQLLPGSSFLYELNTESNDSLVSGNCEYVHLPLVAGRIDPFFWPNDGFTNIGSQIGKGVYKYKKDGRNVSLKSVVVRENYEGAPYWVGGFYEGDYRLKHSSTRGETYQPFWYTTMDKGILHALDGVNEFYHEEKKESESDMPTIGRAQIVFRQPSPNDNPKYGDPVDLVPFKELQSGKKQEADIVPIDSYKPFKLSFMIGTKDLPGLTDEERMDQGMEYLPQKVNTVMLYAVRDEFVPAGEVVQEADALEDSFEGMTLDEYMAKLKIPMKDNVKKIETTCYVDNNKKYGYYMTQNEQTFLNNIPGNKFVYLVVAAKNAGNLIAGNIFVFKTPPDEIVAQVRQYDRQTDKISVINNSRFTVKGTLEITTFGKDGNERAVVYEQGVNAETGGPFLDISGNPLKISITKENNVKRFGKARDNKLYNDELINGSVTFSGTYREDNQDKPFNIAGTCHLVDVIPILRAIDERKKSSPVPKESWEDDPTDSDDPSYKLKIKWDGPSFVKYTETGEEAIAYDSSGEINEDTYDDGVIDYRLIKNIRKWIENLAKVFWCEDGERTWDEYKPIWLVLLNDDAVFQFGATLKDVLLVEEALDDLDQVCSPIWPGDWRENNRFYYWQKSLSSGDDMITSWDDLKSALGEISSVSLDGVDGMPYADVVQSGMATTGAAVTLEEFEGENRYKWNCSFLRVYAKADTSGLKKYADKLIDNELKVHLRTIVWGSEGTTLDVPSATYKLYMTKRERNFNSGWELVDDEGYKKDPGYSSTDPTKKIVYDAFQPTDDEKASEIETLLEVFQLPETNHDYSKEITISGVKSKSHCINFEGDTYLMLSPDFTVYSNPNIPLPHAQGFLGAWYHSAGFSWEDKKTKGYLLYKPDYKYYKKS